MFKQKSKELGLLEPKNGENQPQYLKRVLLDGCSINTRQCRYIGLFNLHSTISSIKKKGFPLTIIHKRVVDPFTNTVPKQAVDVVFMTDEQRALYYAEKKKRLALTKR